MKWLVIVVLLAASVFACVEPFSGMRVNQTTIFCTGSFDVPDGIVLATSNVLLDCSTAVLRGVQGQSEIGLRIENVNNVTVRKCNVLTFNQGVFLKNVTGSLIESNAFLKNRIGLRLLNSYENVIQDNSDKSYQLAISAITSKFNVVMFGNKEVDRAFCQVNSCNERKDMTVCENGDFYCSTKCSSKDDSDCVARNETRPTVPLKKQDVPKEVVEERVNERSVAELKPQEVESGLSLRTKLLVYALAYCVFLAGLQGIKRWN